MRKVNFAGLAALTCCSPLLAQVPPGATPGGALPRVEPAVQPPARGGELFEIPRVYDRPLGLEEGPRIIVKSFKLQGAADRPTHHVSMAEAQAILDTARTAQPAQGFSINQLQDVANKVAAYYRERGYILAQAFVPAQQVTNGEVIVQVLEGRLAGVVVEGNKGYSADTLRRPFDSLIGAPLDKDSIESALLTLTNYPGVTAFGVLGAGREVGTTNLTLRVQSEDRVRLESVVDNYGTQFAGEYRGQVTLTLNDPLHRADRLKLTGLYARSTSSGDSHGAYGGLDYEIPLFSPNDSLRLVHLTNAYNVGAAAAAVTATDSEGDTRVDEIGLRHDFSRTRLGSASIGLAFNVKSATFKAPPTVVYEDKLTTARLAAQWERIDTRFRGVNRIALSYTHGFNGLLDSLEAYNPADTTANAHVSRLGASGEFNKVNVQLQRLQRLTQYTSLILRVDAQFTNDPLVSLEQFSMGGPDSVRAYPVAEVLAEKGGVASLELVTGAPGFAGRPAFGNTTWGQALQVSLFVDYANGSLNSPITPSQPGSSHLAGAGVGVQFSLPGRVFSRLDVATPLTDREPSNHRDPQFYFRFGMNF
ncbi:MAG: ShlB/FhaC/HecB family hemolysin secretion/activation protein [Gammaproteobacteria bacterium]